MWSWPLAGGWSSSRRRSLPPDCRYGPIRSTFAGGGDRAFTLVEVLVSLAVFSVGLVGVGAMVVTAQRGAAVDEMRTRVDLLAQSILEEVTAAARLPGAFTPAGVLQLDPARVAAWQGEAATLPGGTVQVVLQPLPNVPGSRLTVTVRWQGPSGRPYQLVASERLAAP